MPIACDAQSLSTAASCYECQIPDGMREAISTYLLATISNTLAGTSMDPNVLAQNARCFMCFGSEQKAVQTYLLCQIATAVGA